LRESQGQPQGWQSWDGDAVRAPSPPERDGRVQQPPKCERSLASPSFIQWRGKSTLSGKFASGILNKSWCQSKRPKSPPIGINNHLTYLLIDRMRKQLLKANRKTQRPIFWADCTRHIYAVLIGIANKYL
jgi:hypothetical protein